MTMIEPDNMDDGEVNPPNAPLHTKVDIETEELATGIEGEGDCQENSLQSRSDNKKRPDTKQYNSKKPKWWKTLCGRPTKAQKRALREILEDHRLERVAFGSFIDWDDVFTSSQVEPETKAPQAENEVDIWLELGFGRGENLLALAHSKSILSSFQRKLCFVGAEIHQPGSAILCQRMLEGIKNSRHWNDYVPYTSHRDPHSDDYITAAAKEKDSNIVDNHNASHDQLNENSAEHQGIHKDNQIEPSAANASASASKLYSNFRLYPGDGVKLLPCIESNSLAAVLVTFPDPFPFPHEKQWRVIQVYSVLEMHRILRKNSTIPGRFYLATDHDGYFEWCNEVMDIVNNTAVAADTHDATNHTPTECTDDNHTTEQVRPKFRLVEPCPDRAEWLPAISRYEQKGWDEGRQTNLACWEAIL